MSRRYAAVFTRSVSVGLMAALVLLGAGCSSDEPKNAASVAPPAPPSATASLGPSAAAERDALAAYRGMWSAFEEAAKTSDPVAPELRTFASEQALRLI